MRFCGLHLLPYLVSTFKRVGPPRPGLGGIIELCRDINYNQKQLFCAPRNPFSVSLPPSFPPLPPPSVALSRPFLILCKLYYFHCLFTSLPYSVPVRAGFAATFRLLPRVSPFLPTPAGTVLKSFPGTPFPPKIPPSALEVLGFAYSQYIN